MSQNSFSSWPAFSNEEADAVARVLLSNKVNYWTGIECKSFEKEFASFMRVKHAIALANGTNALELALRAVGIGPGDEVIVTPRTFIASVSAIVILGATPIFADVDFETQNITAESIRDVLTKKTKAIICVHLAGWPCDMDPIMYLAQVHNLYVIEDCAQAHGALYKGNPVGSIGDIGAWSFCQDKIMSTGGEGGMVTTNSDHLWSCMWSFKDHGKSWDSIKSKSQKAGFRWVHDSFGSNYRMTEMQAVIGRIQLQRLNDWTRKRRANLEAIRSAASAFEKLVVPRYRCSGCKNLEFCGQDCCRHAGYKCYVFVEGTEQDRDQIMEKIRRKDVPCFSGSCPEVYREKAFDDTDFRPSKRLPISRDLGHKSLMFLCHPTLTKNELDKTCSVLLDVVSRHSFE